MVKREHSILYLSLMDWKWIFQRPQIFALGLQEKFNVKVVWANTLVHRWKAQTETELPKWYSRGIVFPYQNRFTILQKISDVSIKMAVGKLEDFSAIWIADPTHIRLVDKKFKGKIIYDCMDKYSDLVIYPKRKEKILECEAEVVERADLIFASSVYLKKYIYEKYNRSDVILVRNGHCESKFYYSARNCRNTNENYVVGYIGTIAHWVDLELLYQSLEHLGNIKYKIIGPCSDIKLSDKINYLGVVEHSQLYETVQKWDCLLLPFKLCELVEAIEPVKLYEYISFGKCIVSIYYKELEHFKDFVYFYKTADEYVKLMEGLARQGFPPKYTQEQQKGFLVQHSWDNRIHQINDKLMELVN